MNPDAVIVQIDDDDRFHRDLAASCNKHLQLPGDRIITRTSVEGGLLLFGQLAEQHQRISAVVCNGRIKWKESDTMDDAKFGGLVTFARYQKLTTPSPENASVPSVIGKPVWVHHTNSEGIPGIMEDWNQESPAHELRAGVSKWSKDDRGLAVALAIAKFTQGGLEVTDEHVAWAIEQVKTDALRGIDDMGLGIFFSPETHAFMRTQTPDWPYKE